MENLKAIDITKVQVGKDMEINAGSGGQIEVVSRYLLGRSGKSQENL
jgi:hypothetical protein